MVRGHVSPLLAKTVWEENPGGDEPFHTIRGQWDFFFSGDAVRELSKYSSLTAFSVYGSTPDGGVYEVPLCLAEFLPSDQHRPHDVPGACQVVV